ncbi:unnamed protein product [Calypogeia fissa]
MGRGTRDPGGGVKPDHLFSCPPNFFESVTFYRGVGGDGGRRGLSNDEAVARANVDEGDGKKEHLRKAEGVVVDLSALSVEEGGGRDSAGLETAGVKWTCNSCRAAFQSSEEHRSHFKSDFHRLNVKRRVVGKEPINEDEFVAVAEGHWKGVNDDLSSISGSDDESDDPDQQTTQSQVLPRSNRVHFIIPGVEGVVSIWRSVLIGEREYLQGEKGSTDVENTGGLCVSDADLLSRVQALISSGSEKDEKSSHLTWLVLLAAGGHFAGIVVNRKSGEVLAHHTFHRYVVRAKAGGRQSTQDKSGKAPKSAGASLRRYNEAALQKEIRDLLSGWVGHIQAASHIFVHAPSANGQALFGGESAPLSRTDPRIRRIPFTTRRPTYKEAKRVHHILTTISYQDEASILDGIADTKKEAAKKSSKVGDAQQGKTEEGLFTKGPEQSKDQADSVGPSSAAAEADGDGVHKKATPLHDAAKSGDSTLVLKMLEDGVDPCEKDEGGYTPYTRAGDKETRNIFRRFMATHPDLWDWHAAGVPSPLTEEMEASQAAKQAEKDQKRKEREKERKKLKKEQERAKEAEKRAADLAAAALATVRGTPLSRKLSKGASSSTQSAGYQEALLKAQAEERERRAAAAEIRMRAMMASKEQQPSQTLPSNSGSSVNASKACSCCGDDLTGKTPFHRLSYQYCSTTCVQVHKKYLES